MLNVAVFSVVATTRKRKRNQKRRAARQYKKECGVSKNQITITRPPISPPIFTPNALHISLDSLRSHPFDNTYFIPVVETFVDFVDKKVHFQDVALLRKMKIEVDRTNYLIKYLEQVGKAAPGTPFCAELDKSILNFSKIQNRILSFSIRVLAVPVISYDAGTQVNLPEGLVAKTPCTKKLQEILGKGKCCPHVFCVVDLLKLNRDMEAVVDLLQKAQVSPCETKSMNVQDVISVPQDVSISVPQDVSISVLPQDVSISMQGSEEKRKQEEEEEKLRKQALEVFVKHREEKKKQQEKKQEDNRQTINHTINQESNKETKQVQEKKAQKQEQKQEGEWKEFKRGKPQVNKEVIYQNRARRVIFEYYDDFITRKEEEVLVQHYMNLYYKGKFRQEGSCGPEGKRHVYSEGIKGINYVYSNKNHVAKQLSPIMDKIIKRVAKFCKVPINHVLVTVYPDGRSDIPKHSDDEDNLIKPVIIATLSVAAMRSLHFQVTKCDGAPKNEVYTYQLQSRSLNLMAGDFQEVARHWIPKDSKITKPRISFTFRAVTSPNQVDISSRTEIETEQSDSSYDMHPIQTRYIKHIAEDIFCDNISYDFDTREGRFGPRPSEKDYVYINGNWDTYDRVIECCLQSKCHAAVVGPLESNGRWMGCLLEHTFHILRVKESAGIGVFIADFSEPRGEKSIVHMNVPEKEVCEEKIWSFPERKRLPPFPGKFDTSLPTQFLKVDNIVKLARTLKLPLPQKLLNSVIDGLQNNWSTGYRGRAQWAQDHSQQSLEHQDQILAQLQKDIALGRISGPYDRPPFPNKTCPQQPRVSRVFSVPKNKYNPSDPTRRPIFHFSYPDNLSQNHLTSRNDSGMEYHTFRKFLESIARLGKGTLMCFADVKSAYKLLIIKPGEWFLQVFRIGNKYYVDKTGMFGAMAAGDNWNRYMVVDMEITKILFPELFWFFFFFFLIESSLFIKN
jgi:alkylated DNA repair dioxygenase AlkB